jgi:hypothetical protein
MDEKIIGFIALILVIIGGINWALVGLINLDLVVLLCGKTLITRLIYILIGAAACYLVYEKWLKQQA